MTSGNVLVVMMKGPPPASGVRSASTWNHDPFRRYTAPLSKAYAIPQRRSVDCPPPAPRHLKISSKGPHDGNKGAHTVLSLHAQLPRP